VTGNFTAVEPNLVICVTPSGATGARRICTDVCPPGHDCKKPLGDGIWTEGTNSSVRVEVFDNDKQGKITPLAAFTESNPTQCTAAQPCKVDDADDQGAGTLVSFVFVPGNACEFPPAVSGPMQPTGGPAATYTASTLTLGSAHTTKPSSDKVQPTNDTKVYDTGLVDVQTAMSYMPEGGQNKNPGNGIAIHADKSIQNPRFVQFFYEQITDGPPQAIAFANKVNAATTQACLFSGGQIYSQQYPAACFTTTADAKKPDWVPDTSVGESPVASSKGDITITAPAAPGKPSYQQEAITVPSQYTSGSLPITIRMGSGTASGSFQVFAGTSVAPGAQPIYSVDDLKPNGNYKLQAVSFSESKNRQLVLRATGAGSAGSQNTFTYSAAVDDTQNPYAAASPEYPGHIIVDSNGDGTTMTDEPHFGTYNTLAAQKGFTQVVFQGRTFVLSNGQVLACVDWTRQHNVSQNDWSGTYTGVRVTTFNPPLTKLPQPFPMVLDEYNLPDAVGQSMLDTGESYLPPAPQ
jgi:hypothetical protein